MSGASGSVPCEAGCMRKYVIMGIQGSGKGTHAKMLAADFDLEHIAVGDIFRWNVQHHTKLGAQVRRTMAAGLLVGDDLVERVVGVRLREHDWNYGFIIFRRKEYVITVDTRAGKEQVQQTIREKLELPSSA